MFISGAALREPHASTLLVAFNVSFAVINMIMLAEFVRRVGLKNAIDPDITATLKKKWELPAAGAAYALGLWIDKIIMWKSDPSKALVVEGVLQTMPSYDAAMFWAQLSSIPIIAVFFVHVETGFSAQIHDYHERIQKSASLRELNQIAEDIKSRVRSNLLQLFISLGIVASMMIMLSFVLMNQLGLRPSYMSIFRVSVASMVFYTSAIFCFNFLLLLDLRRQALLIVFTFLTLNAILTLAALPLGPDFYGYGNLSAAAISLLVGFSLVHKELSWLHYHAFVTNNSSL